MRPQEITRQHDWEDALTFSQHIEMDWSLEYMDVVQRVFGVFFGEFLGQNWVILKNNVHEGWIWLRHLKHWRFWPRVLKTFDHVDSFWVQKMWCVQRSPDSSISEVAFLYKDLQHSNQMWFMLFLGHFWHQMPVLSKISNPGFGPKRHQLCHGIGQHRCSHNTIAP